MKIRISIPLTALWFISPPVFGDVKELYTEKCASCHGKDGVTKDGKMKAYGGKITDADCKALMDYIRAFKK